MILRKELSRQPFIVIASLTLVVVSGSSLVARGQALAQKGSQARFRALGQSFDIEVVLGVDATAVNSQIDVPVALHQQACNDTTASERRARRRRGG